jgi:hypothetical protein
MPVTLVETQLTVQLHFLDVRWFFKKIKQLIVVILLRKCEVLAW